MSDSPEPVVSIVDDNASVRQFIGKLLASVGLDFSEYSSAFEFLEQADLTRPGCLILDIRMPGMSGLELLQEIRQRRADLPVIVLTGHGDIQVAVRAMRLGALDFFEKPFSNELLLNRVQMAVQNSLQTHEAQQAQREAQSRLASLTPRERQILDLILEGQRNKAIAHALNVSEKTVEMHRANIMGKMQTKTLAELIRKVVSLPD